MTQTPVISISTSLTCHPPPPPPPPPPPSSHFFPTRQSVKSDQLPKGLLKPSGAANAYSLYGNRNGKCALGIYKHFFLPFKISLDFFNLFTTENPKVRQRSGLFRWWGTPKILSKDQTRANVKAHFLDGKEAICRWGGGIKFPRIAGARQATAARCPLLAANCWSHNLKETDPDKIILFSSQHMMKRRFMWDEG